MDNKLSLNFKFTELIELWKEFCQSHTSLYELTCEEYQHMISSEIDSLETVVDTKKQLIDYINVLDERRQAIINEIKTESNRDDLNKSNQIIEFLKEIGKETTAKELASYNDLLVEIVEKIQDQNKTNQIFLNRAIISLQELKENFKGKKSFKTYNFKGTTAVSANS